MAGASFILAINLFIAALFALAFFLVAATNRADGTPRWFALAYCFGLLYIGAEIILPVQVNAQLTYTAGFAAFLGAMSCITIGIASRYRQPIPWALVGITAVLSIGANWIAYDIGRDSLIRMAAYQLPYAVLQAVAALLVWRSRRRQPMDVALLILFCLSVVQFLSKPLVAQWTGGVGDFAQSYIATTYALYSQSVGAILQVALGLLTLLMLVRDMLVEVTARSETDPLSMLLNRRGFEDRAVTALAASSQTGVPIALVTADLDSFKSINDNFGHPAGDAVLRGVAVAIGQSVRGGDVAGRLGGEEFALLLPDGLADAAQVADRLRSVVASEVAHPAGADHLVTFSAGVAALDPAGGEAALENALAAADRALYAAKSTGRDRVVIG